MKLSYTTLDVFTTARYTGNPLSIIHVPTALRPSLTQMQKQLIASEFNLSEIVFLHENTKTEEGLKSREIDIFTSRAEVPFAGHPTVGTAFYLLRVLGESVEGIVTRAGKIAISGEKEEGNKVKAEIPYSYREHDVTFLSPLTPKTTKHPVVSVVKGMSFIFVSLPDTQTLGLAAEKENQNLNANTYDPSALDEGWKVGLLGTIYFVEKGIGEDGVRGYRTRMFGTREDPGTGSASSGLACYLALKFSAGKAGLVKETFAFEQGVEMGRRNEIFVEVEVEGGVIKKVLLSGEAIIVMEGVLEV